MNAIAATPAHITFTVTSDGHYDVECSICRMGMKVGGKFGPIPGEIMVREWVKQHAHKSKVRKNHA